MNNDDLSKSEFEIKDDKYYTWFSKDYRVLGGLLKLYHDDYYHNPPTHEDCNRIFSDFEQKAFKNRLIIDDTLRLWIYPDRILLMDIFGKLLYEVQLPGGRVTDILIEEMLRKAEQHRNKEVKV